MGKQGRKHYPNDSNHPWSTTLQAVRTRREVDRYVVFVNDRPELDGPIDGPLEKAVSAADKITHKRMREEGTPCIQCAERWMAE
jgi:hypothetical protein